MGVCSINGARKTGPLSYIINKNKLKMDFQNLNRRLETIKLLEESIGDKLLHVALGNDFLDLTPKAMTQKQK